MASKRIVTCDVCGHKNDNTNDDWTLTLSNFWNEDTEKKDDGSFYLDLCESCARILSPNIKIIIAQIKENKDAQQQVSA